ncbi:hypothetical protein AWB80_08147 [Caballeronia pedi]|uniref:Uncharacterized protein n=1 Tax=Caballeronia pedi TaxID=1777141 RepID=A0A158E3T0_9BURK|nr:hypothetical protein [Caballeronia pedi]SAL01535.1 hypothetical protein AWB80_08147 [Caballeronia pedi]
MQNIAKQQGSIQMGNMPPESPRELTAAITSLDAVISTIQADQYALESRLSPILDSQLSGSDSVGDAVLTPHTLAGQIRLIEERLHAIRQVQRSVIDRLHV